MLVSQTVLKYLVIPVGVLTIIVVLLQKIIVQVAQILVILDILRSIKDISLLSQRLDSELAAVRNLSLTAIGSTRLGSNDNDTITSLRTIDGSRSGILQYLHALNHRWIQVLDVIHLQTIDDEQRTDITTIGRITTDTDIGSLTRTTRVDNLHTGSLTLEGSTGIGS
ncbi:Uncharacterised protein [Segatella copri]|nr:Uncharacterised protein [Segatella copri]